MLPGGSAFARTSNTEPVFWIGGEDDSPSIRLRDNRYARTRRFRGTCSSTSPLAFWKRCCGEGSRISSMTYLVRADTIYANRIQADEVRGQIHQTRDVRIGDTRGEIKAPEVAASVIYADEITAVVAQNVYVRDLRRR